MKNEDLKNELKRLLKFILVFPIIVTLFVPILLILFQPVLVFPGAVVSLGKKSGYRDPSDLPEGISSEFIKTSDGEAIELLHKAVKDSSKTVLLFHGNGGEALHFVSYMNFFKYIGYESYLADYRGFGVSSGFPTESGLYKDADAAIEYLIEEKGISIDNLIIAGISLGTASASYIASKYHPSHLILFAPFTSIPDVISDRSGIIPYLRPFSFYNFPNKKYVQKLKQTDLTIVHGEQDRVIPFHHGKKVYDLYQGSGEKFFLGHKEGGHEILGLVGEELKDYLIKKD